MSGCSWPFNTQLTGTHRHQQNTDEPDAHQREGGVQNGDHHVGNGQVDDEEAGGGVHPLVLDHHVAHQDVPKERDADDHGVGYYQQCLHHRALGLALIPAPTVKVPQVLQVQIAVEEGLVREAVQCRKEVGCIVILCSPEGLGDVLQREPRVPAHGSGSKAPALPMSRLHRAAQVLKSAAAGGNAHTCISKICPVVANDREELIHGSFFLC